LKLFNLTPFIFILVLQGCTNKTDQSITNSSEASYTPLEHTALFKLIKEKDSLLFQIGFNKIDTAQVRLLTAADFEFYHDEHGVTDTKAKFINNINGIRDLPFKTWRTLVEGSMEIFPLYKENSQILYGAIQNGIHDFYQQNEGEEARKTNTARFTHLWTIENENWKLKRVLSYDHQVPK
jgi:hypothetical protein